MSKTFSPVGGWVVGGWVLSKNKAKLIWCNKRFEIFPKQREAILSPFLIFPGKSLNSCYGASVLNKNSERDNNLLLSLSRVLIEDYQNCI